jgi:iron complex outermembrane recepter protein
MRRNVFTRLGVIHTPLRKGALITVLAWQCLGWATERPAGVPPASVRHRIEQPSQPVPDTLHAIARQTGISVLFDPAVVNGRMSNPVSGQLSATEAILRALEGTGLVVDVMRDGSVVVRLASAPSTNPHTPGRGIQPSAVPAVQVEASPELDGQRLAQVPAVGLSDAGGAAGERAGVAAPTRVEITGSRLRRIQAEGPLPVNTYTRDDIDKSGQPTLERFLSSLNEAPVTPGEGAFGVTTGQGSVQLRGLPLGSTLVLINGRRVQAVGSSSANFFNLSLIPLAAVERLEIVPVGSSAVYGGDALAGVVNIILKKSVDGWGLNARIASGRDTGDGSVSLATGGSSESGSWLLLGAYNKTTPLTMGERDFFQDADYRRFGGPDARTRSCTPGTVTSTTGANLPGLTSTVAGIPQVVDGRPLTVEAFAATAGQPNLCNSLANGNGSALVHGTQAVSLHGSVDRRIAESWSVFGELSYSRDRLRAQESGLLLNNVLVPASNAHNPFGVPVRVTARLGLDNGSSGFERNTDFMRALGGIRGEFGAGWDFEAAVSTSRDSGDRLLVNGTANAAARTAALAASTPAAALNPFTAGRAGSEDVLRGIWSDTVRENRGRKDMASAFVRGAVANLPAGALDAIAGVEYARDRYETVLPGEGAAINSRASSAVYGEFRVPLLRADSAAGGGWSLAALTLAGRRDRYGVFGSASTYQAGLELRPAKTLLFRAAAATSFKPPTLLQTSIDDLTESTEALALLDPMRGNEPIVGGEVLRTANRDLKPEEGRAFSVGALWEPAAGARLGLTAWQVQIDGLIALLWPQVTLDNEALFPGFITRGPAVNGMPGPVTRVLYAEVNFGRVETAGVDIEASHAWKTAAGRWNVGAGATRTGKYDVVIAPGAPLEDRLNRRYATYWAPQWKARLSAGFDQGVWSVGLTSRYTGGYKDAGTSERRLGDAWVHDLSARLNLAKLGVRFGMAAKAATLSLGIVNLADRQPEFVATSPYYDVTQADWRGRYASLRLSVDW